MFKQLLILLLLLVLIIIISYHIIKKIVISFHKLVLSKFIIKYNLIDSDKQFLNLHSEEFEIGVLESDNNPGTNTNTTRILFYTDIPWSTKNNNYIFDVNNNKYYIITDGYYYYIDSPKDFKITIGSPNGKVKILLLLPNNNKVSFLENNNV